MAVIDEDRGKVVITVVLALVTLVASIVVALQFDASTATAAAERQADAAGLERSEADARGNGDQIVDYGMYRAWSEQLQRVNWAVERIEVLGASDPEQTALLSALAQTDSVLADFVRANTDLLKPPFFDEQSFATDFIGYLADRAADGLRAGERFDTANAAATQYQSRSAAFLALITVLAASLFFLGLAGTTRSRPRQVLVAAGLAFAIVGTGGAAAIAVQPVHRVGEAAIDAVVRATVEVVQGPQRGSLTITGAQRRHSEAAIAASAEAVALDPAYPGAWRSQGETNLHLASAQYLSNEHPDVSALLARAIDGYERSLTFGKQDFSALWNLGWARYIYGDLAGSLAATNEALTQTPDRFTLFLNRALVELAQGDGTRARATIESGLDVAARARLGSLGTFLAESDFELGRLAELRPAEAEVLREIRQRVREAEVSIAISGEARTPVPAGTISIGSLTALTLQAEGSFGAGQPIGDGATLPSAGLSGLRLELAGRDVGGQVVALRLRRDGLVDQSYSQLWTWSATETVTLDMISPYGRAGFTENPGAYEIEVYLAGHLADTLTMTVAGFSQ